MESEIFLLFDEKILQIYIQEEKKLKVVGQFARFIAAYYLNLKTIDLTACEIDDERLISLPNLLVWSHNDEINILNNGKTLY